MELDNNGYESAEMQDVAAPADVASEETEAVAEPPESEPAAEPNEPQEPPQETPRQDAAWAEMRRRNDELQRQLQEQQRIAQELQSALSLYFEGESAEDLSIAARAYAEERSMDEVRKDYERERDYQRLTAENSQLQEELTNIRVDRMMRDALAEIQAIDPGVTKLEDLGDTFADYIAAGLSTKQAYYATKAMESNEKVYAPPAIGKAKSMPVERDYYTSEELDALTDAEIAENYDKVWRSMDRLSKQSANR